MDAEALGKARRLEVITLVYMLTAVIIVFLVMGSSQAMKAAWIEDLLGLIPPIAFLYSSHRARRKPTVEHPYGYHRSVGAAHLASAVALLAVGLFLIIDSGSVLITAEHPSIGTVRVFGVTFWAGWLMIAALAYTGVGPVILGRMKLPLSEKLHDKVLHADAEMNKADWMTAGAAIIGVLGIGIGLWWADSGAALVIATSICKDGITEISHAVKGLADGRARTFDDSEPHPLLGDAERVLTGLAWVSDAKVRVRDMGHVFHTEAFVVPWGNEAVALADLEDARQRLVDLDWKMQDVVVVPVPEIPEVLRRDPARQN